MVKYLTSKGLSLGNKVCLQVGVPNWILSKEDYIKACIRGLIDTDGSFVLHRYTIKGKIYTYPKISFSNRSEPLLEFVYQGLRSI
ncbi:LAGLIDADG family homing endonuclease [Candidatus Daviesbacteria bacterium]|nr:LAGLIDADG family homing endonuclease [Candidatus Daviesbacteria bacterium]